MPLHLNGMWTHDKSIGRAMPSVQTKVSEGTQVGLRDFAVYSSGRPPPMASCTCASRSVGADLCSRQALSQYVAALPERTNVAHAQAHRKLIQPSGRGS